VLLLRPVITQFAAPSDAWLLVAMASTFAGNLTIVGSIANLIVVEVARAARIRIGFFEYCKVGVPLTLATLLAGWLLLVLTTPAR
jgi:Na+/H+ antiporter NhaD/arsenite permease-like protein